MMFEIILSSYIDKMIIFLQNLLLPCFELTFVWSTLCAMTEHASRLGLADVIGQQCGVVVRTLDS
ncbi:UNVERIFIED_CONTAM: hypothetical protein FKN15_041544 [Acipenser sinensis]